MKASGIPTPFVTFPPRRVTKTAATCGIYPYRLAAWRLRGHLTKDEGDIWTRAANYHSRTPKYNTRYRYQLMHKAMRWNQWLGRQFNIHAVKPDGMAQASASSPVQAHYQNADNRDKP